ncbi:ABC transporter permease [Chitinophaga costaii]|nr:ABC transporter permease [Chitinophaga costaii]
MMQFRDTFSLASRSVKGNRLRSGLTISIIAFGIMALVGILTAIDSMKANLFSNFSAMGTNTFSIRNRNMFFMGNDNVATKAGNKKVKIKRSNQKLPVRFSEAVAFKEKTKFPETVGISFTGTSIATVYKDDKKTNPNVSVIGGDENYLDVSNYDLAQGRNLNALDLSSGRNVAIVGQDVVDKIFGNNAKNIIGNTIRVGDVRYRVIGVLAKKGSSNAFSADNIVITSLNNVRRIFDRPNASYQISIKVNDINQMDAAVGEATGLFRQIRHLDLNESDNFVINKSDDLAQMLYSSLASITFVAIFIGIITLVGSAIGLMNIMLVSVAERTREIGVSKALGATSKVVRRQFLYEAIIISVTGGALGALLGMIVGNVVSLLFHSSFIIPWMWIFIGVALCALVGLVSGVYPAMKAARLNPIVALHYE